MGSPYIGEIRMFAGNFAPENWAFCDGRIMSISQNETLFILIGTTYGGDGVNTFALPDLRGRVPMHNGQGFVMGEPQGSENVLLDTNQLPAHGHAWSASMALASGAAGPGGLLASSTFHIYGSLSSGATPMAAHALANLGGGLPHDNMAPFLTVTFIISLFGIFPVQS